MRDSFHSLLTTIVQAPQAHQIPESMEPLRKFLESEELKKAIDQEKRRIAGEFLRRKEQARRTARRGKKPQNITHIRGYGVNVSSYKITPDKITPEILALWKSMEQDERNDALRKAILSIHNLNDYTMVNSSSISLMGVIKGGRIWLEYNHGEQEFSFENRDMATRKIQPRIVTEPRLMEVWLAFSKNISRADHEYIDNLLDEREREVSKK